MTRAAVILSLLHEPPGRGSATRRFRGEPVLAWTLRRLARARRIDAVGILCWDDQLQAIAPLSQGARMIVVAKGPRGALPELTSIAAARRWADGWRGGLLGTCHFDLGFHGPWHHDLACQLEADSVVLAEPSSGLIDPALVDALVDRADADAALEFCFAPAAPGLGAALLKLPLLNRLAAGGAHAGRLLHYHPDQVSRELLASDACVPVPTPAARTTLRFALDSDRQVQRITAAMEPLNGQLIASGAEELVQRCAASAKPDPWPREVVLELNVDRATRPIFWPGRTHDIRRPALSLDLARRLFDELSDADDVRLTLGGVGDPLLNPELFEILDAAAASPGMSVHVETDFVGISPEVVRRLAAAPLDVVSVHLPAVSATTYEAVMGCDGYAAAIEHIRAFVAERQARRAGVPLIVPIFTKCPQNLAEMEGWYDQWLRAVGSAVVRGPSDAAGQMPDVAVADMSPPRRRPCTRIASRMTIVSDGRIVSCEEDFLGRQTIGRLGEDSIRDVWANGLGALRAAHAAGQWGGRPLCAACREWHRP